MFVHGGRFSIPGTTQISPPGHVLLDDPLGRRQRGREHCLHGGYNHYPGRRQRQARGDHNCDADETRGCSGTAEDGNGYG